MRLFRTLPVATAAALAFAVVVPASCSSTDDASFAASSDASVEEIFGTKAVALTTATITAPSFVIRVDSKQRVESRALGLAAALV